MPFVVPVTGLATETLVFDPVSEDPANAALEVISGSSSYGVLEHSYPAPPQEVQYAGTADTEGDVPGSRRHRNRTITMKIDCSDWAGWLALQEKVAKLGRVGGTLRRDLPDGSVRIYDILANPTYDAAFGHEFYAGVTTVDLAFDAKPYARGELQTLSTRTETSLPFLVFTETGILGDVDAIGDLTITDIAATSVQTKLWWAWQSLHYDPASTAALYYETESLEASAATAAVGSAGASGSGSNVLRNTNLPSVGFQTQFFSSQPGPVYATHEGGFRVLVRARCPNTNTGTVQVRLGYVTPEYATLSYNDPVTFDPLQVNTWQILDLGIVTIGRNPIGTHRWVGQFQAMSSVTGDDIEFDWVAYLPVDEGYGEAVGSSTAPLASPSMVVSHDRVITPSTLGTYTRAVYEGDYLRVPPAGAEGRTLRLIVKLSQGNGSVGTSDAAIEDISAQLSYTPRYLI